MINLETFELLKEYKIRKARVDFFTFCKMVYPSFHFGWFQRVLCEEFQNFYNQLVAGNQPRLMLFAPPRHGKSTTVHAFSAWAFGQNPDLQQIGASYGATLACKNNRHVQRIMDTELYREIFPETLLPDKRTNQIRNNDEFEIVGHNGSYRAAGVGGSMTGTGCDIGIIDDPVKGMKEASSSTVQSTQRDWYHGDFYTRLSPASGILLFLTRWHMEDLAGYLVDEMEKGGDIFTILSFPAIAETDEYQYRYNGYNEYGTEPRDDCECVPLRKCGDALHPERWPLERLDIIKRSGEARGVWGSLYQQSPTTKGGDIFKIKWFPRYDHFQDLYFPGDDDNAIIATAIHADTAMKIKEVNDFSVFEVWGIGKSDIYLLDVLRGKWEAPELITAAESLWQKWKGLHAVRPPCRGMYIEDKASGTGLIQSLRRKGGIPIIAVQRSTDKIERSNDIVPWCESGNVWLPEKAPWLGPFEAEISAFNKQMTHAHDDQVDPLIDAVEKWLGKRNIFDLMS